MKDFYGICRHSGLNQGPSDLQSDALPAELCRQILNKDIKDVDFFK